MGTKPNYPVQTTNRSLDIIEALKEGGPQGVSKLADDLDMSKSIVHNHLATLEDRGYVLGDDGTYRISFKFLGIGGYNRKQLNLYSDGRPEVEKLAAETGEMASLATEERGWCVYLFQAKGEQAVKLEVNYEGMHEHMHSTALGKALLAYFPDERIHDVVERHGLPKHTEQTITSREALFEDLETVRERGYAVDDQESIPGLRCMAAPIKKGDNKIVGSVSVSGPVSRIKDDRWTERLPELISNTANVIEINTQYSSTGSTYQNGRATE